ncbi:metalloproteinase inhibitor 2-like [Anableps anableps]
MSCTMNSCLVALAILFLWRVEELAEACSCTPVHPQQAYCNSEVAIRARVVGMQEVESGNDVYGNPIKRLRFDVKQYKMFRGPTGVINAVYTAPSSALCGVTMETNGTPYLITGKLEGNGTMHVTLCDFVKKWETLNGMQMNSLSQRYEDNCDCKITHCASVPCMISSPMDCLWTDWVLKKTVNGDQAKYFACLKRNDGSCAWYRGGEPPGTDFLNIKNP